MWLNLLAAYVGVTLAVMTDADAPGWLIATLSAANLWLRSVTTEPVTFK